MKNRMLILAYDFPPIGGSGVQRTLKFVKYLPDHGWDVDVLTVRPNQTVNRVRDESLLEQIPDAVRVHRSSLIDPYDNVIYKAAMWTGKQLSSLKRQLSGNKARTQVASAQKGSAGTQSAMDYLHSLMVPDRLIGWFPFALIKGIRLIRKHRPSVIFTTSPCETSHLVGYFLSKMFKIPHVADFRDPWTNYYFALERPWLFDRINRNLENRVLKNASLVISTAEECSSDLEQLTPEHANTQFKVITNGYDESDFRHIKPKVFSKFTVIFNGTVYRQVTPENIFIALRKMLDEKPSLADELQFIFVGNTYDGFEDLVAKYELEEVVRMQGYLPHQDSIAWLMGANLCYYNVLSELAITAKLFEYLRSGTEILATIPEGHSAAQIIRECGAGEVVDYNNVDGIVQVLTKRLNEYQPQEPGFPSATDIYVRPPVEKYERQALTSDLSKSLKGVVAA